MCECIQHWGEGISGIWNVREPPNIDKSADFSFSQIAFPTSLSEIHVTHWLAHRIFLQKLQIITNLSKLKFALNDPACGHSGIDRSSREVESSRLPTRHLGAQSDTGLFLLGSWFWLICLVLFCLDPDFFHQGWYFAWFSFSFFTFLDTKVKPRTAPLAQDEEQEEGGYAVPRWKWWWQW